MCWDNRLEKYNEPFLAAIKKKSSADLNLLIKMLLTLVRGILVLPRY